MSFLVLVRGKGTSEAQQCTLSLRKTRTQELFYGFNEPGIFSVSVLRVYPSEKDNRGNLW